MLSLFKLCMFLMLVVLIVYASRVYWQTETFETQCPTLSFIENQVEVYNDDNVLLSEEQFIQEGLQQITTVLNNISNNHSDCTLSAHYKKNNIEMVSQVITNQTTEEEKKDFLKLAYSNRSTVDFNACLNGSRYIGTASGAICKPDSTSTVISGGSQGCNEHNNDYNACLNDNNCVLYRKMGKSGSAKCYPKCSTITNLDECNNNSQSFCEYTNGKCRYKCSKFNTQSTLNDKNACLMSDGCKVHENKCVETDGHTSNSDQHHNEHSNQTQSSSIDTQSSNMENKSNFLKLTMEDDQNLNMYKIVNKENEDVGYLPKCKNSQGQIVENSEGTFSCEGMNVCLDNDMLNFVGGISSELNAKELVNKINQRCGNNI